MSQSRRRGEQNGFTIPEILIAFMIGFIIVWSAMGLFKTQIKHNLSQTRVTEAQDTAISALQVVTRDLRMLNFGQPILPTLIGGTQVSEVIVVDEDEPEEDDPYPDEITFITAEPVTALAADVSLGDSSIPLNNPDYFGPEGRRTICVGGLDVVTITGIEEEVSIDPALVYSYPADTVVYVLKVVRYSVQNGALARTDFADASTMAVAGDVADFQLKYGLDTDDDGSLDVWMHNPGSSADKARAARIWILIRSKEPSFLESRTYTLGNRTFTPEGDDQQYRYRVLQTHVQMRNMG